MNEEQEVALEEATTTAMQDAPESAKGLSDDEQAPDVNAESETEVEKTESQKRRERRKANAERIKADLEATKKAEAEARAKLARLEDQRQKVKEPKRDDFDDPDEYVAARAAWHGEKSYSDREAGAAKETADQLSQSASEHAKAMWAMQVEDAQERFQDFEAVAYSAPISEAVATMIATTQGGADVAYHLGRNHHIAAQLSQLALSSPIEAAVEIGRLSASLSAPKAKTKSDAPPPIKPVNGRVTPSKDPAKMSHAEYRQWRMGGG